MEIVEITPKTDISLHLLQRAEYFLREFGWIQHENHNENGVCLVTALNWATAEFYGKHDFDNEDPDPVENLWTAVYEVISDRSLSLVSWNDEETTDFNQIVNALRHAGEIIDAR